MRMEQPQSGGGWVSVVYAVSWKRQCPSYGLDLERATGNPSWINGPPIPDSSDEVQPMAALRRKKFFVDPKVQGAFLARIVVYWFLCLVASGTVLICWTFVTGPAGTFFRPIGEVWSQFGPAVLVSALMLPILLFDCIRLTNRLAAPMFRVLREMRNLANGAPTHPIYLRTGDFWTEIAEEFNAIRQRVILLEERLNATPIESPRRVVDDEQSKLDELQLLRAQTTVKSRPELVEQTT